MIGSYFASTLRPSTPAYSAYSPCDSLQVELITIVTLLLGFTIDTNAAHISRD